MPRTARDERGLVDRRELDCGIRAAQHSQDKVHLALWDPDAQAHLPGAAHETERHEGLPADQALELGTQETVQSHQELLG
jgi:hypothetical protein